MRLPSHSPSSHVTVAAGIGVETEVGAGVNVKVAVGLIVGGPTVGEFAVGVSIGIAVAGRVEAGVGDSVGVAVGNGMPVNVADSSGVATSAPVAETAGEGFMGVGLFTSGTTILTHNITIPLMLCAEGVPLVFPSLQNPWYVPEEAGATKSTETSTISSGSTARLSGMNDGPPMAWP